MQSRLVWLRFLSVTSLATAIAVFQAPCHAEILPVESTSAFKLLELEGTVRTIPPDATALLRRVIEDATVAASNAGTKPVSPVDALAALKQIQVSLVKQNFLQPDHPNRWPMTLGEALTPLQFDAARLEQLLAYGPNQSRRNMLNSAAPYYFVDCDMGSQIFIAVAQRLGWDIRLVQVPNHNYIRWHLADGSTVNWDWVQGASKDDSMYGLSGVLDEALVSRGKYLRSYSAAESDAYYLGLVGLKATRIQDRVRLLAESLAEAPELDVTQNNHAWAFATWSQSSSQELKLAVSNALAGLSVDPTDGNRADTLACLFSRIGEQALAVALEDYAVKFPGTGSVEGFKNNKARIQAGQLCE
jgi:hypothetical protein